MSSGIISFWDGVIVLDGLPLPGILRDLRISGSVKTDKADPDGMSGEVKTPMGFSDARIVARLDLLSDPFTNCYLKLAALNAIFRSVDEGANPKIYTVASSHILARSVRQVMFSSLDSAESDRDDVISVTCTFTEHNPAETKKEAQVAASQGSVGLEDDAAGKVRPAGTDIGGGATPPPVSTPAPKADPGVIFDVG